ncbi:hypothetical protein KA005_76280 [bacterium]|nr:hypothetical protein [bacterium]
MLHRAKLDARRPGLKTKRAALIGDFLDDAEKENLDIQKEKTLDVPQPEGEKLTPVRPLPGGPKLRGEVEEAYTPMSAEEIAKKRKEHEKGKPVPPIAPGEEVETEIRPAFRNIIKDLLRKETPEGKKEQVQLEKYGPPEDIKSVIDVLEPFQKQLAEVDETTVKTIIERSTLPDILKDRAKNLFESRTRSDGIKTEQLALNLLGARTRKEVQKMEEWLRDTEKGQVYMSKAFEMYRTRRVMNMLSNTILAMEGQAVIDQPKGTPRPTPEQRVEKKRIEGLVELLNDKRITDTEFEDAKRTGKTADEVVAGWAVPKKEPIQQRVEREYREEEARRRKGEAVRLNMEKTALHENWRKLLPEVQLRMAMSSSTDPTILEEMGLYSTDPQVRAAVARNSYTPLNTLTMMRQLETDPEVHGALTENINTPQEGQNVREQDYSWGPEGPPPGITNASRLNMKKTAEGDATGPGGDSWEYEWTGGPTPTKDEPQKRKFRFPFRNKPSTHTPGEGEQGNLHDIGPLGGQQDMNYLANIIKSMIKTSDNDMFSVYSFDNDEKWLTYTLFKKAYSKFRPGDIVVQYGYTPSDCQTYRRRFGSVKKAKKSLVAALSPVLAAVVSVPSPDDSLHDLQKGKGEPGGAYGPRTNPYDQQPWHGNRDGFDAKNTPRQRTKRKFIPHMDTPDDESSGLLSGSPMGKNNKRNIFADARLTPAGEEELQALRAVNPPGNMADLYMVLDSVASNRFITSEDIYLEKTDAIIDAWSMALKEGFIISEDLPEDEEFLGELPGGMPEGMALSLKQTKKSAMPPIETPEERAAIIEQPPIKPINKDPKRPFTPKKRYDKPEQNLTNSPNYMGEDSSGWGRERIHLSMKKKK